MEASTIAAYDRPVPRYTSYPTAAQFDASVGPVEHAAWLKALNATSAAVYLHVPFCREICFYCACNTGAMRRRDTLEAYAGALMRELDEVSSAAPEVMIHSVQWGGGTPSQLGAARLIAVGRHLSAALDVCSGREMSMEVDPRHCDVELVAAMATLGVTRASLGVQDFDMNVQRAINRLQSAELTNAALERLRSAGIRHCNIDLVYGLPCQTLDTLSRTLDQAVALQPDRFAVFAYAHVPWMKPRQALIDAAALPGAALRADMADLVSERLTKAGYLKVGLDHYARPGDSLARAAAERTLRRNFQGYVADRSPWVIGLGASAISCLPPGYTQNAPKTADYMTSVERTGIATTRGVAWSSTDRLRGDVISELMCHFDVDLAEICRRHGVAVQSLLDDVPALAPLIDDGLARRDGTRLAVTARGRPLIRSVCAAFDRYYTGVEGRHARGI